MNPYKSEFLSSFPNLVQGFIPDFNHDEINLLANDSGLTGIHTVNQIHSDIILKISHDEVKGPEGDSLYTDLNGVGVGIYTADCLPIIYFAEEKNIVGAIHAGWRGTLKEIVSKTFTYLTKELSCTGSKIYVALGPSIEGDCYEVGEDVAGEYVKKFNNHEEFLTEKKGGKFSLDLLEANLFQLKNAGITNFDCLTNCTFCDKNLPSYRRDGKGAGRILSFIGLV